MLNDGAGVQGLPLISGRSHVAFAHLSVLMWTDVKTSTVDQSLCSPSRLDRIIFISFLECAPFMSIFPHMLSLVATFRNTDLCSDMAGGLKRKQKKGSSKVCLNRSISYFPQLSAAFLCFILRSLFLTKSVLQWRKRKVRWGGSLIQSGSIDLKKS